MSMPRIALENEIVNYFFWDIIEKLPFLIKKLRKGAEFVDLVILFN